jgi:uncharacterized protein (TIGR02466 family)
MEQSDKIGILYPFTPYIYKLHFDFDWNELKPVCEELIQGSKAKGAYQLTNGHTSQLNGKKPYDLKEFASFYSWVMSLIPAIARRSIGEESSQLMDINGAAMNYSVINSWVNVHQPEGITKEHNHACTAWVIAAYLNVPENSGNIKFRDPLEYSKSGYYHDDPQWMWKSVPITSGDVLVFPGWLIHKTEKNMSQEDRWVLTTNIFQEFAK